jgi:hypothetical protein
MKWQLISQKPFLDSLLPKNYIFFFDGAKNLQEKMGGGV